MSFHDLSILGNEKYTFVQYYKYSTCSTGIFTIRGEKSCLPWFYYDYYGMTIVQQCFKQGFAIVTMKTIKTMVI